MNFDLVIQGIGGRRVELKIKVEIVRCFAFDQADGGSVRDGTVRKCGSILGVVLEWI
jgi:hypothetical protein